jgi:hypothetical protein
MSAVVWDHEWQAELSKLHDADPMGKVNWEPIMEFAMTKDHYHVYTSKEVYLDKSPKEKDKAYKDHMSLFYRSHICMKVRNPEYTNAGRVKGVRGTSNSAVLHHSILNAAMKADVAHPRRQYYQEVRCVRDKTRTPARQEAAVRTYQNEHPGQTGSSSGTQLQVKIQDVVNIKHSWNRAANGSQPLLEQMTMGEAFGSKM